MASHSSARVKPAEQRPAAGAQAVCTDVSKECTRWNAPPVDFGVDSLRSVTRWSHYALPVQ